jgi:hypothetical protein
MQRKIMRPVLIVGIVTAMAAAPPRFDSWTPPVNLGSEVNTVFAEVNPCISRDGLSLYFACLDCPGGHGGFDLYVSQRSSRTSPWQPARNLGAAVNTSFTETNPELSDDGRLLFLTSNRPGSAGLVDVYVSRRHNKRDDFGWEAPQNLGSGINSAANDRSPDYFEDDATGEVLLYLSSDRIATGSGDIFVSSLQPDQTFGRASMVTELSTAFDDDQPMLRKDGLELFLHSNRPGSVVNPNTGLPSLDLWVSTRRSTAEPWSLPVNLGTMVNSAFSDTSPGLSWDGRTLYFSSAQRLDNLSTFFDLWSTTRSRLRSR